jgi:hypothetical protein
VAGWPGASGHDLASQLFALIASRRDLTAVGTLLDPGP